MFNYLTRGWVSFSKPITSSVFLSSTKQFELNWVTFCFIIGWCDAKSVNRSFLLQSNVKPGSSIWWNLTWWSWWVSFWIYFYFKTVDLDLMTTTTSNYMSNLILVSNLGKLYDVFFTRNIFFFLFRPISSQVSKNVEHCNLSTISHKSYTNSSFFKTPALVVPISFDLEVLNKLLKWLWSAISGNPTITLSRASVILYGHIKGLSSSHFHLIGHNGLRRLHKPLEFNFSSVCKNKLFCINGTILLNFKLAILKD